MEIVKFEQIQTVQDWENALVNYATLERHVQFYIGDLIAIGFETGYVKRGIYDRIVELTGIEKGTLKNYVSVSKQIRSSLRNDLLKWSIHKEVAKLEEPKQIEFLQLAVDGDLTARELREAIRVEGNTENEGVAGLPDNKYKIIYADPPWSYGNSQPNYVTDPTNYYNTMSTKNICAIPIKDILQDNAVLFLWTTSPHLQESFSVIEAWGFNYKTSFIWNKVKHNMGHYNSVRHEFLLLCIKGSCPLEIKQLFNSVQTIERNGKHSEKPEQFRTIIDTIYPNGKRIELFARGTKKGWDTWGNESNLPE